MRQAKIAPAAGRRVLARCCSSDRLLPRELRATSSRGRPTNSSTSGLFDAQLGVTLGDRGQSDRALARVTTAASALAGALDPSAPRRRRRLRRLGRSPEGGARRRRRGAGRGRFGADADRRPGGLVRRRRRRRHAAATRRCATVAAGSRVRDGDAVQPPGRGSDRRGAVAQGRRDLERQRAARGCRGGPARHLRVARPRRAWPRPPECARRVPRQAAQASGRRAVATGRSSAPPTSPNAAPAAGKAPRPALRRARRARPRRTTPQPSAR